jgi:phosphoribosylglycinamide formyltransferase 1
MKNIAIFASGSGSNAENIIKYVEGNKEVKVALILTNNPNAGVLERAHRLSVPALVFNKTIFKDEAYMLEILSIHQIDYVILAGFLWLVPVYLIVAFPDKIINVHPALLPKYGGKGMWGHHVHEAVVANKEAETGITIHLVNEKYDEGRILFQAKCEVLGTDTPEDVAKKIHVLEFEHFPRVILGEVFGEIILENKRYNF